MEEFELWDKEEREKNGEKRKSRLEMLMEEREKVYAQLAEDDLDYSIEVNYY